MAGLNRAINAGATFCGAQGVGRRQGLPQRQDAGGVLPSFPRPDGHPE